MGNLWLKIKVWTKIILFSALALYALLFIAMNGGQEVKLWIWYRTEPERSVLLYMLFAFLTGVIGTILVRTTFRTIGQVRELRARSRTDKAQRQQVEMQTKAGRLQTRPEPRAEVRSVARPAAPAEPARARTVRAEDRPAGAASNGEVRPSPRAEFSPTARPTPQAEPAQAAPEALPPQPEPQTFAEAQVEELEESAE